MSSPSSSIKIEAKEIKDKLQELSSFVGEKIGVVPSPSGDLLIIDTEKKNIPVKLVKTYLKRFLHKAGLRGEFRVLVSKEVLSIRPKARKAKPAEG